jgi:hypothetical protein
MNSSFVQKLILTSLCLICFGASSANAGTDAYLIMGGSCFPYSAGDGNTNPDDSALPLGRTWDGAFNSTSQDHWLICPISTHPHPASVPVNAIGFVNIIDRSASQDVQFRLCGMDWQRNVSCTAYVVCHPTSQNNCQATQVNNVRSASLSVTLFPYLYLDVKLPARDPSGPDGGVSKIHSYGVTRTW